MESSRMSEIVMICEELHLVKGPSPSENYWVVSGLLNYGTEYMSIWRRDNIDLAFFIESETHKEYFSFYCKYHKIILNSSKPVLQKRIFYMTASILIWYPKLEWSSTLSSSVLYFSRNNFSDLFFILNF